MPLGSYSHEDELNQLLSDDNDSSYINDLDENILGEVATQHAANQSIAAHDTTTSESDIGDIPVSGRQIRREQRQQMQQNRTQRQPRESSRQSNRSRDLSQENQNSTTEELNTNSQVLNGQEDSSDNNINNRENTSNNSSQNTNRQAETDTDNVTEVTDSTSRRSLNSNSDVVKNHRFGTFLISVIFLVMCAFWLKYMLTTERPFYIQEKTWDEDIKDVYYKIINKAPTKDEFLKEGTVTVPYEYDEKSQILKYTINDTYMQTKLTNVDNALVKQCKYVTFRITYNYSTLEIYTLDILDFSK